MSTAVDAGKRISDIINGVCVAQPLDVVVRSFMAFSLDNGESDNVLYDSVRNARKHQKGSADNYVYFCLRQAPGGINPKAAWAMLMYARGLRAAGYRMPDPDSTYGDRAPMMPLCDEDLDRHIGKLLSASGKDIRYLTQ